MNTNNLPKCELANTDGSVFAIIGHVVACLKNAGLRENAAQFRKLAYASKSYDEVIQLCFKYVDVV